MKICFIIIFNHTTQIADYFNILDTDLATTEEKKNAHRHCKLGVTDVYLPGMLQN